MTPICRPCRRTARALRVFASNFIFAPPLRGLLAAVDVEGTFFAFALLILLPVIADQRLHDRDEGAGNHEEIAVEDADEFEERVVARHDLAGLDARDVHLGQAQATAQLPLAPAALDPRLLQLPAHVLRKALRAQRFDMLYYIFLHA